MALGLRGRRLIVSTYSPFVTPNGPPSYLFERGVREAAWIARATLAGDAQKIDLFGNTAMLDRRDVRTGSHPTVVVLPALREPTSCLEAAADHAREAAGDVSRWAKPK